MISTRHRQWARLVFTPVIEGLLRRQFGHFYAVNERPEIPDDCSLLLTPNHFSWWDGFFLFHLLFPMQKRQVHIMMLESQLKKYWYFRHIGAYSIDPEKPSSAATSLRYTARILSDPKTLCIIYPQGKISSYTRRPPELQRGVKAVLSRSGEKVKILPMFFRIEYYEEKKPDLFFAYGPLLDRDLLLNKFEAYSTAFTEGLAMLDRKVENREILYDCFRRQGRSLWHLNS